MREKTARLRRMLDAGYRVEDIASDSDGIEVALARGPTERVVLRLERDDAAELLGLAA
jgi:hypothetical protein